MEPSVRGIGLPALAILLVLAAGCRATPNFVYKPGPAASGERNLPVDVAVLPFEDGTENFTERGTILGYDTYSNLAKTPEGVVLQPLQPPFWGKSFADDLAASGCFRSVRFVYDRSELRGESIFVDGTLKKTNFGSRKNASHEILIAFRATRRSDNKVVWEKEIDKAWKPPSNLTEGCGAGPGVQCVVSRFQDDWNRGMAAVFAEARADLVATLATLSERGARNGAAGSKNADPAAGESVDRTIDRILKGN